MTVHKSRTAKTLATVVLTLGVFGLAPATAQNVAIRNPAEMTAPVVPTLTYADIASLADAADLVLRAQVRKTTRLKPEQAPGLAPGMARLLVEARTLALLAGPATGETVRYLADVPLDAKGKVPKLKKAQVLVFARTVRGRPGELALVDGGAQIAWTPDLEARVRGVLTELLSPDAPPRIKAVREVLFVPGNLTGEGETQIFLQAHGDAPISLSVIRRPGQPRVWGVSLSEIVDQTARPPERDTLTWYRLACSLPPTMPPGASLSGSADAVRAAAADYAFVIAQLGPCTRTRPAVAR